MGFLEPRSISSASLFKATNLTGGTHKLQDSGPLIVHVRVILIQ